MSATMARQGGRVQLEQCKVRLAMNIAKMAKGGIHGAAIEDMQYLFKKPRAKLRDVMKWVIEFPGEKMLKSAKERHLIMLLQNHTTGRLSWHNCTAMNSQTFCRRNGTGAPAPAQCRYLTPPPKPHLPRRPPAPTGKNSGSASSQIGNMPVGSVYSDNSPPRTKFFTLDAYAQESQQGTDFDPYMLTDKGTSTG